MFDVLNGYNIFYIGVFLILMIFIYFKIKIINFKKSKSKTGVFAHDIVYADQKGDQLNKDFGKILYSEKYDLQGKPDYIFASKFFKELVPVEIKSGHIKSDSMPHHGDLLQLVAYFLIIEDVYGKKPKKGRLVYQDYMFTIKNTKKLQKELKSVMNSMHQMLIDGQAKDVHSFVKCRYCICRGTVCELCEK